MSDSISLVTSMPPETRALVRRLAQHHLARLSAQERGLVGLALRETIQEPGGALEPYEVIERRFLGWLAIWRTRARGTAGAPPFGATYNVDGAPLGQVKCRVCGARWTANLEDPRTPLAIGQCPIVGPVTWVAGVSAVDRGTWRGREFVGWVTCWVCG